MSRPTVLMPNRMQPLVVERLDHAVDLVKLWEADDQAATLSRVAPTVGAIAVGGHVAVDPAFMKRFPALGIVSNFGVGYDSIDAAWAGRERARRDQYARRARRGSGRHGHRADARHRSPAAGRRTASAGPGNGCTARFRSATRCAGAPSGSSASDGSARRSRSGPRRSASRSSITGAGPRPTCPTSTTPPSSAWRKPATSS